MKLLKCKLCAGEVDIIGNIRSINKKIKCKKCGFSNLEEKNKKITTEIVVIKSKN